MFDRSRMDSPKFLKSSERSATLDVVIRCPIAQMLTLAPWLSSRMRGDRQGETSLRLVGHPDASS